MKKITKIFLSFPQAVSFVENLVDGTVSLWKSYKTSLPVSLDKRGE